jgi:hypothetical protein
VLSLTNLVDNPSEAPLSTWESQLFEQSRMWFRVQVLADSIKSFEERKDIKGKDPFDLSDWWNSNCAKLPAFTYVADQLTKLLTVLESL